MSTPTTTAASATSEVRAQPRIRWPRPTRPVVVSLSLWLLGLLVASLVPALTVSPSVDADPSGTELVVALSATVAGSLVMVLSAYLLYRRTGSIGAAIIAFVPGFVLVTFGILLTTITTLY